MINVCDKTLTVVSQNAYLAELPFLWIRTAASPKIGFGHLRRCLILAQSLLDCSKPVFLIDSGDRWCRAQLAKSGCGFFCEESDSAWVHLPDPAAILIDTRHAGGLDHLVITAQDRGVPVISIHDMGLNPLSSDVIIDGSIAPSLFQGASSRNAATFRGAAATFRGADYMVLDPAFRALHQKRRRMRRNIRTVVINMGGGDSQRFFPRVLEGLKLWAQEEVEVIGLRGFVNWGQEKLEQMDWHPLHFRWECAPPALFLADADLAITAGGLSAYEALCAGTPLLALSYDPLQQAAINAMHAAGACINLGPGDALDPTQLAKVLSTINAVNSGISERKRISLKGRKIVDGRGAERVSRIVRQLICNRSIDKRSMANDREIGK